MQKRTVRELSGEIWAEIEYRALRGISPYAEFANNDLFNDFIDLISGILARYDGSIIINDEDLPVTPLPPIEDQLGEA